MIYRDGSLREHGAVSSFSMQFIMFNAKLRVFFRSTSLSSRTVFAIAS